MELRYQKLGKGPLPLLAFHGIGQTGGACFDVFGATLGDRYTIYAFDLPFHGDSSALYKDSRWDSGDLPLSPDEWQAFLLRFLDENQIGDFSVAGFSLGGRFALATLTLFPGRIERAYLIASDGIKEQWAYRLATGTGLGRKAFRLVMKYPGALQKAAGALNRVGLLHTSVLKVLVQMTSYGRSLLVYRSWVNFRQLKYRGKLPVALSGRIFLFVGKYDRLIKEASVRPLARTLDRRQVILLNAGHTTSVQQAALEIQKSTAV